MLAWLQTESEEGLTNVGSCGLYKERMRGCRRALLSIRSRALRGTATRRDPSGCAGRAARRRVDRPVALAFDAEAVEAGGRADRLARRHRPAFRPQLDAKAGIHNLVDRLAPVVDEVERRR